MRENRFKIPALWRTVLAAAVFMVVGLSAGPAMGAEGIDTEADKILTLHGKNLNVYAQRLSWKG